MTPPTIGRIVVYRSKTGDYDIPAIVNCTTETINEEAAARGSLPTLAAPTHVHLTCFTPGISGMGGPTPPGSPGHPGGGTYQEWDVPFDGAVRESEGDPAGDVPAYPGTWRWPERV